VKTRLSLPVPLLLLPVLLLPFVSTAAASISHTGNYTLVLNYGQTPYQTGYLASGNITGWTWWDTNGGLQQKNLITLYIFNNTKPVRGLSPPTFNYSSERYHSSNHSWAISNYTDGIDVWHIIDNYSTRAPPWEDIKLEVKSSLIGRIISFIKSLLNIQSTREVRMTFWTWYDISDDTGYVKISTDRGYTWKTLKTYTGNSGGWVQEEINLTGYSGEVLIAFNFVSNAKNRGEGWWIDDIDIYYNNELVFSDDADTPPPRLTATISYPVYDIKNNTRSMVNRSVELVEDYAHNIYYSYFFYQGGEYTGAYKIEFNTTPYGRVETVFNTTLWGCQQRGCHDAWTDPQDLTRRNPTNIIHPDDIKLEGDCLTMCHTPYTSQFLTASPMHVHELQYGHLGGFMKTSRGWTNIYRDNYSQIDIYYKSPKRPLGQTSYNQPSHLTQTDCEDCHTTFVNTTGGGETYNLGTGVLQGYNIQRGGVHKSLKCSECHGIYSNTSGLAYPPVGSQYTLTDSFNYTPLFTSFEAMTNTYIVNVTGDLNLTITAPNFSRFVLTLIGPVDQTTGLQDLSTLDKWQGTYFVPSINGTLYFNLSSKIYYQIGYSAYPTSFNTPLQSGIWIARIYNLYNKDVNYTITSNMPLARKPVIKLPSCTDCHNPNSSYPGARTYQPVPDWDKNGAAYTHTDFNNDTRDDVACRACHNSFHNITLVKCQECHVNPPEVAGHLTGGDYTQADLNTCLGCHADPHLEPEKAGGPDCISCHGLNGSAVHRIDENAMAEGVHANLNSNALNSSGVPASNKKCWACHTSTGIQPQNMGDRYDNPLRCLECHNGSRYNAPVVSEHYKSGIDITASTLADNDTQSCVNCHSLGEMRVPEREDDPYSSGLSLASHYNRKRWDILARTENYCYYCHRNESTVFPFENKSRRYVTHGDECQRCHGSGRIHNATLSIPNMEGSNSECLSCHSNQSITNLTVETRFEGAGHGDVRCSDCHTPRQVFQGMIVNRETLTYNFTIPTSAIWLNATLDWDVGRLELTLEAPDNTSYSHTTLNISSPPPGNWTAVIQDMGGDADFKLTIDVVVSHPGSTPKKCEECHVNGFGDAPRVYKHLPGQSDVPTNVTCDYCHSRYTGFSGMMGASHYPVSEMMDSQDCVRCHLDIESGWGDPPDPRNHTSYTYVNLSLPVGEPWHMVDNYTLTLLEVDRQGAMFRFEKDGVLLRRELVSRGDIFEYNVTGVEPGRETVIVNLTVQDASPWVARVSGVVLSSHVHHDTKETNSTVCYACHDSEYRSNLPEGMDYYVLEKRTENGEYNITLARLPVNFTRYETKVLQEWESWDLPENYTLKVKDIDLHGGSAQLTLYKNGTRLEEDIVKTGDNFTHEEVIYGRNVTVFNATLKRVFATRPFIILSDVKVIGSEWKILNSTRRVTQEGTPAKYLRRDTAITIGGEPETFHVFTITPGGYSTDCVSCHTQNGVAPIKIDLERFKRGVHAELNSNASYESFLSDPVNLACWACHGNGTGGEPLEHPTPYLGNRTPLNCKYCHIYGAFNAKQVYSHYPGASISTNATCVECHSNTLKNKKDERNLRAAVSHYQTRRLLNTSNCNVCHNNQTNAPMWGNAPQVKKHTGKCTRCHTNANLTNFHQPGITITRRCEDCHLNTTRAASLNLTLIQTHYPGAPQGRADTLKQDYTCRVCHNVTERVHTTLEVREYQNKTMGYCFQCHSTEGKFPHKPEVQIKTVRHGRGIRVKSGCEGCHDPEGISRFHTPTLITKKYFTGAGNYKLECTSCHEKHEEKEYQPFRDVKCTDCHTEYGAAHYANARITLVNKTRTCKLCHNREAERFHNLTHLVGNVTEAALQPCYNCHVNKINFSSALDRTTGVIRGTMFNLSLASISNETLITCKSCHNATGRSRFHYDAYPLGSVQDPGWEDWTPGNKTKCKDCHTRHGGEPPFNATNMGTTGRSPSGTAHGFAPNCTICHGGADPIGFHSLATTEFIPRIGVTLEPATLARGEITLLRVTVVLPPLMKVTRAEYFIDTLGIRGSGRHLKYIVGGANQSTVLLGDAIDTHNLSYGRHLIFVQVKDSAGKWSKTQIAVLTVTKERGMQEAEILLKEGLPLLAILALLYIVWRRFR